MLESGHKLNCKKFLSEIIIWFKNHRFQRICIKIFIRWCNLLLSLNYIPRKTKRVFHTFEIKSLLRHKFRIYFNPWKLMWFFNCKIVSHVKFACCESFIFISGRVLTTIWTHSTHSYNILSSHSNRLWFSILSFFELCIWLSSLNFCKSVRV